jgi:hypothetical protein
VFGPLNAKGGVSLNLSRARLALYDKLQYGPLGPYTQLLLHFDGTSIFDSSPNKHNIGVGGGVALSTTQSVFGGKSLRLPGGSSYLSVNSSDLLVGLQDFTIDCRVRFDSVSAQQFIMDGRSVGTSASGPALYMTAGKLTFYDGATAMAQPTAGIVANTWYHVQFGRKGTTVYLFLDGVLVASGTFANNWSSSANWIIGAAQYTPIGAAPTTGYMDEFRGLVGKCTNTASFTPPPAPY